VLGAGGISISISDSCDGVTGAALLVTAGAGAATTGVTVARVAGSVTCAATDSTLRRATQLPRAAADRHGKHRAHEPGPEGPSGGCVGDRHGAAL